MKRIWKMLGLLMLTAIMVSFSQCSSTQKLQTEAPTAFGDVYFQRWVSGVAQGSSGLNIYIEVKDNTVKLDSVYFGKTGTKLSVDKTNKLMYVGRFVSNSTEKMEVTLNKGSEEIRNNEAPEKPAKNPFDLAPNECVISYKINDITRYFKLENVTEKKTDGIPM